MLLAVAKKGQKRAALSSPLELLSYHRILWADVSFLSRDALCSVRLRIRPSPLIPTMTWNSEAKALEDACVTAIRCVDVAGRDTSSVM